LYGCGRFGYTAKTGKVSCAKELLHNKHENRSVIPGFR
jgi:hypothetical protein